MLEIVFLLLVGSGFFLSLWVILPAPVFSLLPLSVGVPEISPGLILFNAIALSIALWQGDRGGFYNLVIAAGLTGLLLSALPLIQLPATNSKFASEMARVLGTDYLAKIPPALQDKMRSRPFVFWDIFRGISLSEVRIDRGIVFASRDGIDLKLNTYRPLAQGKYPALIIIYGGAWRAGTANNNETFSRYIANRGYSVIAIDYRHAPKYKFPIQIEDVKTALQYILDNADELEVDRDRLAIMGRSAGGHLAKLAAYQTERIPFRAVVSYYGSSDLVNGYKNTPFPNPINTRDVLHDFLGGTLEEIPQVYEKASPFSYVKASLPPTLLIYGSKDCIVQAKFGERLSEKLKSLDNRAVFLKIPWADHAFDAVFSGISNQLALYYTERFLAWALSAENQ